MAKHTESLPARRRYARLVGAVFALCGVVVWLALPAFWASALILMGLGAIIAVAPLAVAQSTASWGNGADGEARTAALLEPLAAVGAIALQDRRIPRWRAKIDHIVICPGGVLVVETKNYKGDVGSRGDVLTVAGRPIGAVAKAQREAQVVADLIAPVTVTPLIVIHRAYMGVRRSAGSGCCGPVTWPRTSAATRRSSRQNQVTDLAARLIKALPPAAAVRSG
jgi:hypothetical protein